MNINIDNLHFIKQKLRLDSNNHRLWINLGYIYNYIEQTKLSLECFNIAKYLAPSDPESIFAMGHFFYYQRRYKEARSHYLLALELAKKNLEFKDKIPSVMYGIGLCELAMGNEKEWLLFNEYRTKKPTKDFFKLLDVSTTKYIHNLKEIKSLNEIRKNSKLLVLSEQGFGDQIMYARYLRELRKLSGFILFQAHSATLDLFKNCKDLKDISIKNKISTKELHSIDGKIFLLSIPSLLKNHKNKYTKPLHINSDELICHYNGSKQKNLKNFLLQNIHSNRLNVGLCWKGREEFPGNYRRSIKLRYLKKLFTQDISFFSLQKDISQIERGIISKFNNIFNLENYINNFSDMALIADCMDVIITICSSPAHLAGSLNKKTYLLLDKNHHPQWNEFKKKKIYNNFTILKQKSFNCWKEPINYLRKFISAESNIKLLTKSVSSHKVNQRRLA